jgi:hypothetical protein
MDATGIFGSVVLLDWAAVLTYASFLGIALFGAVMRTLLGLYKAYTTYPDFTPSKVRMGVEILASTCFGLFATLILDEMGVFKFGLFLMALFSGFLGADLIGLITKKLGLTKSMNIVLSERQMKDADLTENQARAMQYARMKGEITNKVYQRINLTDQSASKKALRSLVLKGRLTMTGSQKGTRYVPTDLGPNRALFGPSDSVAQKGRQKRPSGMRACLMGCLEGNKRLPGVVRKQGVDGRAG